MEYWKVWGGVSPDRVPHSGSVLCVRVVDYLCVCTHVCTYCGFVVYESEAHYTLQPLICSPLSIFSPPPFSPPPFSSPSLS